MPHHGERKRGVGRWATIETPSELKLRREPSFRRRRNRRSLSGLSCRLPTGSMRQRREQRRRELPSVRSSASFGQGR